MPDGILNMVKNAHCRECENADTSRKHDKELETKRKQTKRNKEKEKRAKTSQQEKLITASYLNKAHTVELC